MRYFFTLLRLRLWAGVRSAFFWGLLALLTGLALAFCVLLPEHPQGNVGVGLYVEEGNALPVGEALLQNEDYRFTVYQSEVDLKQSVLTGEMHCAYGIGSGERPITLYRTESSYMTPIVNEVVLSAYLDAYAPALMADFLVQAGLPVPEDMDAYFAGLRERSEPMTVELTSPGEAALPDGGWARRYGESGMQVLLYAVLGALLPVAAVLRALLHGREAAVRYPGGHTVANALAPLCADAALCAVSLLAADAVIAALAPAPAYTAPARLIGIAALALLAALCAALVLPLARPEGRLQAVLLPALPIVLVLWVLLSGAVLDPALLPGALGALRWASPPWYFLRVMALLSV